MKIEFHTNNVALTSGQREEMEKKLLKTKKFIPDEPVMIDVILQDETSSKKGGVDQMVKLIATFGKEKIYIEEVDERLMKAFGVALERFERDVKRYHEKRTYNNRKTGGLRWEKVLGAFKIRKNKKIDTTDED
jgi:ribosomal subunit interface protein